MTTCKHRMRTYSSIEDNLENGVWLAGFLPKIEEKNYLLMLARVGHLYYDMQHIYQYMRKVYPDALKDKLAHRNYVGDIYQPKRILKDHDRFNPDHYVYPTGHCREVESYKDGTPKWHRDINYTGAGNRRHRLIVFDKWVLFSKPIVYCTRELHRSGFKTNVSDLFCKHIGYT